MAHTFTNLLVHATFSTKGRAPMLDEQLRPRVCAYMGGIARDIGAQPLAVNGARDHVHLELRLSPRVSVSDTMRLIKTNSSRWVNEKRLAEGTFGWQTGYGAFTVSESNREAVGAYVASQEEHHRRLGFKAEFEALLRKHGIAYDENHLWG